MVYLGIKLPSSSGFLYLLPSHPHLDLSPNTSYTPPIFGPGRPWWSSLTGPPPLSPGFVLAALYSNVPSTVKSPWTFPQSPALLPALLLFVLLLSELSLLSIIAICWYVCPMDQTWSTWKESHALFIFLFYWYPSRCLVIKLYCMNK